MSIDIEKLQKLAEAATRGPWFKHYEGGGDHRIEDGDGCDVAICEGGIALSKSDSFDIAATNAAFIAAFNPQTAIALLQRIAELEADALRYRWLRDEHERIDPMAAVVWKLNRDRNSSEWVNTNGGADLDVTIDAVLAQKEMP